MFQKKTLVLAVCALASLTVHEASAQIEQGSNETRVAPRSLVSHAGDTVLIADTDNGTGEEIFDRSLKQALLIDLEQSPFFSVLSDSNVRALLQSPGEQARAKVLKTSQIENVCDRLGGKAIVKAGISKNAGKYRVAGARPIAPPDS